MDGRMLFQAATRQRRGSPAPPLAPQSFAEAAAAAASGRLRNAARGAAAAKAARLAIGTPEPQWFLQHMPTHPRTSPGSASTLGVPFVQAPFRTCSASQQPTAGRVASAARRPRSDGAEGAAGGTFRILLRLYWPRHACSLQPAP
eukprot:364546-Chlamydomonas_euryale.AAC.16